MEPELRFITAIQGRPHGNLANSLFFFCFVFFFFVCLLLFFFVLYVGVIVDPIYQCLFGSVLLQHVQRVELSNNQILT